MYHSKTLHCVKKIVATLTTNSVRFIQSSDSLPQYRIENVLIVGSGVMGCGIAQACAIPGRLQSITLQDNSPKQVARAHKNILASLTRLNDKKMIQIDSPEEVATRIRVTTDLKPASDRNLLVLETITEVLAWKQDLFRGLTNQFRGNNSVFYASNTSSLLCTDIAKYMQEEDRKKFAGLHFFDAILMKLAEIARTRWTSDQTFDVLKQFTVDIDKVGVGCVDTEGMIVNKLQIPMIREAVKMVERGDATVEEVDTAMKLGAGYPMGPFEEMDFIGLDTCKLIIDKWTIPDGQIYVSSMLNQLVSEGNLGRKTGKGFYDYTKKRAKKNCR